jgi:hypothetical protein
MGKPKTSSPRQERSLLNSGITEFQEQWDLTCSSKYRSHLTCHLHIESLMSHVLCSTAAIKCISHTNTTHTHTHTHTHFMEDNPKGFLALEILTVFKFTYKNQVNRVSSSLERHRKQRENKPVHLKCDY